MRDNGVNAVGADLKFKQGPYRDNLIAQGHLSAIDPATLRLPYEDNSFDFVIADQVLEHVRDIDAFSAEIARVLRKGGVFIGYYPSRWKLREPHVGVPLAGVIRWRWWIALWVKVGVYKTQRSGPPVDAILAYLAEKTSYRSLNSVRNSFGQKFVFVQFEGKQLLKTFHGKRARGIVYLPFGPQLFNALWSSMLIARSPISNATEWGKGRGDSSRE